jgi:chemotaxis protein histidine kinase CheA
MAVQSELGRGTWFNIHLPVLPQITEEDSRL